MSDLSELRKEIDAADEQLLSAFVRRMEASREIGRLKKETGKPVRDPVREAEKLEWVCSLVPGELEDYSLQLYRILFMYSRLFQGESIGPLLLRCGLLGEHLGHSLSPQIHACFGQYKYRLFEKKPEEVEAFVREGAWDGLNVTIPYKKTVVPFCDRLSSLAQKTGSVNTMVKNADGLIYGDNTDVYGFRILLKKAGIRAAGKKALVLGSGGGSAAVCEALREENAGEITVVSRSGENNYSNLERHADAKILVNATPVGMFPNMEGCPVSLEPFPQLEAVVDLIYNPEETVLLRKARERGLACANGLVMLVAQAARSEAIFNGLTAAGESVIFDVAEEIRHGLEEQSMRQQGKKRILVLNGPNLNLLGLREPEVYGRQDYAALEDYIRKAGEEAGVYTEVFQTNHEGELVDRIQAARGFFDGIVINPAAYTHTSIAILDALKAVGLPAAEVHLSDITKREPFRRVSYAGFACGKTFAGLGFEGYRQAIRYLTEETGEKTL